MTSPPPNRPWHLASQKIYAAGDDVIKGGRAIIKLDSWERKLNFSFIETGDGWDDLSDEKAE